MADERLPDFLIIGAMKAGTTTLYGDLGADPRVFFPSEKEPADLCHDRVLSGPGRARYTSLFQPAGDAARCGEASTYYTMQPDYTGAASRAQAVLGPELRLIYLVRHPIARAISHHRHAVAAEDTTPDIDEAIRHDERFVNYSDYAMQLEPWLEAFGPDRLRVVVFERYTADRRGTIADLQRFLGLDPRPELVDPNVIRNTADSKRVTQGAWKRLAASGLYRRMIRPLLPGAVHVAAKRLGSRPAPPEPAPPSPQSVAYLAERLGGQAAELQRLVGGEAPGWDMSDVALEHFSAPREAPAGSSSGNQP